MRKIRIMRELLESLLEEMIGGQLTLEDVATKFRRIYLEKGD